MELHPGFIHDPDFDGPGKLPAKQVPLTRGTWLLAAVAFLSVTWAVISMVFFFRAAWVRFQKAQRSSNPDVFSHSGEGFPFPSERPSPGRPLFGFIPAPIREQGLPGSEIGLAADVRAAEVRGGAALWESHMATGVFPFPAQKSAAESLRLHALPDRKIDGWLMQVGYAFRNDEGMDPKSLFTQGPPGYSVSLRLPANLAGYEIWLSGYNYDPETKTFACADLKLEAIKHNDWVRVSGVLRPDSGMEWKSGKPDDVLSLGEMTICDIQRVEAVPK